MHKFANPARFNRLADILLPWCKGLLILSLIYGLYHALIASPADFEQGEGVRMMYVHVPAAWMSMFVYMVMAGASFTALVWKHPLAYLAAKAAAPIGATFTALALITGSLWGKPMWGTYWIWDGRLTSMLVLLFLYLGYMAIWQSMEDDDKAGKASAIVAIVGIINIPIIKFSVDWWNTLHQPASVMKSGGPSMPSEMLIPLLAMFVAFNAYFMVTFLWRMKLEINRRKIAAMRSARISQ